MKFFWKIFFVFTAMISVAFSVFGIWLITQSFHQSLEREIEDGERENRMFQFAFEVNMNSLSENYRTEKIVTDLVELVTGNLNTKEYSYRVYRGKQKLIYETSEIRIEHGLMYELTENTCVYQVLESGGSKYLIFVCKTIISGQTYYLESVRDITALYDARDGFYARYRIIMLGLIGFAGFIVLVVSHFLTRSVTELSDTTRRFAKGDYDVRANVLSEDEVGTLAQDFNQMADNLTQKMDELTEAARKQEDFTASFAHELKTPLTSIIGYADMLRTMDMTKEETMEASNYIYSQGKRLESLSFKLLELIVTGKQKYQFKKIPAQELLMEVEQIVKKSMEAKQILLTVQAEEGMLYGEKDLLTSLFVNLADNARKAVTEEGHIRIGGRNCDGGYEVSVTDDGCGMPQEEIKKITEAFYMVDKSRSRKEGGAGLGMTLAGRIVELHGAEWQIESQVGRGTTVRVMFREGKVQNEDEA